MKTCHIVSIAVVTLMILMATPLWADEPEVVVQDRQRIQAHLLEVEEVLSQRDTSHLSQALQAERKRNIEVLRAYRKAGEFPHNTHVPWRQPVFIDRDDRACAVGHLMIESGWEEAAYNIADRENLAYLPDMKSPEVEQWVAQSGLTADEAAWIQPTYSPCMECQCTDDRVCGVDGNTYYSECVASHCAGVEVAFEGCCKRDDDLQWENTADAQYMCGNYDDEQEHCSDPDDVGEPLPGSNDDVGSTPGSNDDVGSTDDDVGVGSSQDAGDSEADAGYSADSGIGGDGDIGDDVGTGGEQVDHEGEGTCAAVGSGSAPVGLLLVVMTLLGWVRIRRS